MNIKQKPDAPILIVDDEQKILRAMDITLRMAGYNNIITSCDGAEVTGLLARHEAEIILLDLTLPKINGEELLGLVNAEYPEIPVIIVTGAVDVETAVRCMKSGAFDYIVKPVEEGRLLSAVGRGIDFRQLKRENLALRRHILSEKLDRPEAFSMIITNNKKMLSIFQYIESIAGTMHPVLITGETGTGKELIARAIHNSSGRGGEFVAVNVAGLDDSVFTDTLFGHIKGAFTGADTGRPGLVEQAAGGTLMLDEIGDLNQASQVKLLRFLQEGEYRPLGQDKPRLADVRTVAATNEDLGARIKSGAFRKDLNYRLRIHHIDIPPLRMRRDDIPLLLDHFVKTAAPAMNKKIPVIPGELTALLEIYSFPGNVRELQAMVFDAVSGHKSGQLSQAVFKRHMKEELDEPHAPHEPDRPDQAGNNPITFSGNLPTIKDAARMLIMEAMKRAGGNQSIAAAMLGITQQALSKRLRQESRTGAKPSERTGFLFSRK